VKIAAIVLAAGLSRRYGPENKLLQLIDGVPMIWRVVDTIGRSMVDKIMVVTGHQAKEIETALAGIANLNLVHNPEFEKGMSTSISIGIKSLGEVDACLICLGDLPHLTPKDYDRLIQLFNSEKSTERIMIPTFQGRKGHPVVFGSTFFNELRNLQPTDQGARNLIVKHKSLVKEIEMATNGILTDIDFKDSESSDYHGV